MENEEARNFTTAEQFSTADDLEANAEIQHLPHRKVCIKYICTIQNIQQYTHISLCIRPRQEYYSINSILIYKRMRYATHNRIYTHVPCAPK